MDKYDCIRLKNQLCFPLYVCAKEVISKYKPFLDKIDLTYTQYITMMFLWENDNINVKALGSALYLDSGTLTPLLKKLESKGFIVRSRMENDERNLVIKLTEKGKDLKDKALSIPQNVGKCINLSPAEAKMLYDLLYKVLEK